MPPQLRASIACVAWATRSGVARTLTPDILAHMRKGSVCRKIRHTFDVPGHAHELTFSCYRGLALLGRDRTRRWMIESLVRAREHGLCALWAYVIMPEHVHVLLRPATDITVAQMLKAIKQPVSRRAMDHLRQYSPTWLDKLVVARPSGRAEHRFWQQGGGYDRNIIDPKAALAVIDYLHANPVRRGLVARATDWPWSSVRWYAGMDGAMLAMDHPAIL
jgi:putative transposase